MEKEENKLKFEDILELMEKTALSIEMTREKQDSIDKMLEEIYDKPLSMEIEDKKKEIESKKEEKAEFDEMTKKALINAKKLVLQLREQSENEYQEALLKTSKKQMDINKKLASIRKTLLEKEELDKISVAEEKAKNSLEKASSEMKEFQDKHFELRKNLELQEKDIWNFALELGVEEEIDSVSLEDEVIDNEDINNDNTSEDKQIKRTYKLRNTTFEDAKGTEKVEVERTETAESATEKEQKVEKDETKVEANKEDLKSLFVNGILRRLEKLEKIDEEKWTPVEYSEFEMIWNELGWNSDMRQAFCEACEVSDDVKNFLENTDFTQIQTYEEKIDIIGEKLGNISLKEDLFVLIKTGLFEESEPKGLEKKLASIRKKSEVVSNVNPEKVNDELNISFTGKDNIVEDDDISISFEGMEKDEVEDDTNVSFEVIDKDNDEIKKVQEKKREGTEPEGAKAEPKGPIRPKPKAPPIINPEKISITFNAKTGEYTLLKEKTGQKINLKIEKIGKEKDFMQFVDYIKEKYIDFDKRNADPFIAYLLYKEDKDLNTNNLDTYMKALTRMEDLPKNIKLVYNMKGIYGKDYTEKQSNLFMNCANHALKRKLAEVNKGTYVKFLEKHDKIRHTVAKVNEFINNRGSKVKLLSSDNELKQKEGDKITKKIKNDIKGIRSLRELKEAREQDVFSTPETEKIVNSVFNEKKEELEKARKKQIAKVFRKQRKNNKKEPKESDAIGRDEVSLEELGVETDSSTSNEENELAHGFVQKVHTQPIKNKYGLDVDLDQIDRVIDTIKNEEQQK